MDFHNEFEVPAPVDATWEVVTDLARVAPCLPGATLTGQEGDRYLGTVKVKVGPITASYRGEARFESLDPETHVAVLRAEGREQRGQGRASATVTATLTSRGEHTHVAVDVDLQIAGRVAQFGRGVLAEVSEQLIAQFASQLAALMQESAAEPSAERAISSEAVASDDGPRTVESPPAPARPEAVAGPSAGGSAIDVLGVAWKPLLRRAVAPLVGLAIVVSILLRRRGRRRRGA